MTITGLMYTYRIFGVCDEFRHESINSPLHSHHTGDGVGQETSTTIDWHIDYRWIKLIQFRYWQSRIVHSH